MSAGCHELSTQVGPKLFNECQTQTDVKSLPRSLPPLHSLSPSLLPPSLCQHLLLSQSKGNNEGKLNEFETGNCAEHLYLLMLAN